MTDVWEAHARLYHYTTLEGLKGILETQTLWATHYKALNDFSEVHHMRQLLEKETYRMVNDIMRRDARKSHKYRRFLDKYGGLAKTSRLQARRIVDIFYEITFEGRNGGEPFAEPYVVSFCSHTDHGPYVQANGLLSMWRAYGDKGGYAVIFDTKRLWNLLRSEMDEFHYSAFYLADVVYDNSDKLKFKDEFGELWDALTEFVRAQADDREEAQSGKVFQPLFNSVTRFKHQGFQEENEVRLTASPISKSVYDKTEKATGEEVEKDLKPVYTRTKRGIDTWYIVLNEVKKRKRLPILKIIVGPQTQQSQLFEEVKMLAEGKRITVVRSETPFIPA